MAKLKVLAVLLCILVLLLRLVSTEIVGNGEVDGDLNEGADSDKVQSKDDGKGNLKPSECAGECKRRCSRTHHKKPCLFFCNKCCANCLCVPPGYYGNKETCLCYNNWKTKKGGAKCP